MSIKKYIPNAITSCNLICGCLALTQTLDGNLIWAAYLVGVAAICDFFDGFAARKLNVASVIGKDLDSLADMVTFGLVPGFVVYKMLQIGYLEHHEDFKFFYQQQWLMFIPLIIPVFSALRLAKFNNDSRQTESFIGLPTPANAIFFCSIPLIVNWDTQFDIRNHQIIHYLIQPYVLIGLSIIMSFLMVAELPLIALKFKNFAWKGNEYRYLLILFSILWIVIFQYSGLTLVILSYVALSVVQNITSKPSQQSN